MIPEVTIFNVLNGIMKLIRSDYSDRPDKKETILYNIFGNNRFANIDLYEQSVTLFTNVDTKSDRYIRVRPMLDMTKANIPTVYMSMESSQPVVNEDFIGNGVGTYRHIGNNVESEVFNKRYSSKTNVVITSSNLAEVIIIYHVLNYMLLAVIDTLDLSGLDDVSFSASDISQSPELSARGIFSRYITISYKHDMHAVSAISSKIFANTNLKYIFEHIDDNDHSIEVINGEYEQ